MNSDKPFEVVPLPSLMLRINWFFSSCSFFFVYDLCIAHAFFPRAVFRSHNLTISICLVCFPCTLLPVPSRTCWRPPCCRPRTDHSTRYNPGPLCPSASRAYADAAPFSGVSPSALQRWRSRPWKDRGNQTLKLSLRFPLHFISQVPH